MLTGVYPWSGKAPLGPYLSDRVCDTPGMNGKAFEEIQAGNGTIRQEPFWLTVAGCTLFWAGLLTLYWIL